MRNARNPRKRFPPVPWFTWPDRTAAARKREGGREENRRDGGIGRGRDGQCGTARLNVHAQGRASRLGRGQRTDGLRGRFVHGQVGTPVRADGGACDVGAGLRAGLDDEVDAREFGTTFQAGPQVADVPVVALLVAIAVLFAVDGPDDKGAGAVLVGVHVEVAQGLAGEGEDAVDEAGASIVADGQLDAAVGELPLLAGPLVRVVADAHEQGAVGVEGRDAVDPAASPAATAAPASLMPKTS